MTIDDILNTLLQPHIFPFFFIGMWVFVAFILRKKSGFTWKTVDKYMDANIAESMEFTNGNIDGVNFSGVLHIYRLDNGFMFRMAKLFMGGGRYVADKEIVTVQPKKKLIFKYVEYKTSKSTLTFSGAAADFMLKHYRGADLTSRSDPSEGLWLSRRPLR